MKSLKFGKRYKPIDSRSSTKPKHNEHKSVSRHIFIKMLKKTKKKNLESSQRNATYYYRVTSV